MRRGDRACDCACDWSAQVSTSRYWFNYRHTANALSLYHTVKVNHMDKHKGITQESSEKNHSR